MKVKQLINILEIPQLALAAAGGSMIVNWDYFGILCPIITILSGF
jgi:hypothetical protein